MNLEVLERLRGCLEREELVGLATALSGTGAGRQLLVWPGGQMFGDLGSRRLDQRVAIFAEQPLTGLASRRKELEHEGEAVDLFFEVFAPPPKLIVIGAVHVAIHLVDYARTHGYKTYVIDPRSAFATAQRFERADHLLTDWPAEALAGVPINEATYFAFLSHDPKIDLPGLKVALESNSRYIGALGSKKTHAKRLAALAAEGLSAEQLARIHSPIGLDLGGRRAEEIALAIMAEIVAVSHGVRAASEAMAETGSSRPAITAAT